MANQKLNITIAAIDKTKGAFGSVTKSLGIASKALFSFKTAIVGAVGVGGLGLLVNQSLKSIDALGKTADKLGVTTEALGAMRYAAELTGVATQTTDMAMQRFTRRLSEAAAGTGEAKGALIELGINAKELTQLPLDQQMLALSDAFSNVQGQSDRVRLAFKLFDSEGVALVSTLSKGRAELAGMFAEAEDLGILLSADAARGVEDANDALLRLSRLFGGIKDQIVAALAPALETLATALKTKIVDGIKAANGSVREFAESAARLMLNTIGDILIGLGNFLNQVVKFTNDVIRLANEMNALIGIEKRFSLVTADFTKSLESAGVFVKSLADNIGQPLPKAMQTAGQQTQQLTGVVGQAQQGFKKFADSAKSATIDVAGYVERGMEALTQSLANVITGAGNAKDAFKDMARSIINDIAMMVIRQQITAPIAGAISSALPTFFGGGATGKAIGGSVQAGKPYMVGERGAEMFVPSRSGSIVPNQATGDGVSVIQNINISTGVQQTVRAEIQSMLPQIANASKAAVLDARRRGGSFAAAFGG